MRPENYEAQRHPPSNEYELNIGPNHPGIEGNYAFKLKLHGDRVIEGRADAGYLHRGFEKLMEGRLWIQNLAITPRICVPDPVPMEISYCLAVEDLCGLEVPERALWLRVLQSESRVSLVIPRASILLREDSVLGDNLASSRIRPAVAAAPDFPLVRRARQRPQMARRRVGCALHFASTASGLAPLRHCGNTPAPTPIRDYRPSLRSPWPAADEQN